ncbi:CPBP family intramembrane metalloprotease [Lactiplantibacillus pentosus]|uniref:CPBP family intramembrane glutamic endopeptidase n=1 Tax=Lactiplantibacillus pentosus TaxID=1589 RepID=UPI00133048D6|nr:type II CAAX endopeptidase family protein [Lactiplantibacillus pentosus]MBQ0836661.1 CPBP family intramembrane metalloprotease [Lactiplantibacillus pentosus]
MGKIFKIQGLPVAIFKLVMIYLLIQLTDIPMNIVELSRNRSGDFGFQTGLFVAALIISLITVSAAWYIYRGGRPIQRQQWSLKRHWLAILVGLLVFLIVNLGTGLLIPSTKNQAMLESIMTGAPLPLWLLTVGVVAPIMEELTFRGVLMDYFFQPRAGWLAILVSGTLFGLIHQPQTVYEWLVYAGMGWVLATAYWLTKTILVPIMIHILNNCGSLVQLATNVSNIQIFWGAVIGLVIVVVVWGLWHWRVSQQVHDIGESIK